MVSKCLTLHGSSDRQHLHLFFLWILNVNPVSLKTKTV